jgi:hypothetical protein
MNESLGGVNAELERLRSELSDATRILKSLKLRVIAKDREFAQERAIWKSEKRKLMVEIRGLRRGK